MRLLIFLFLILLTACGEAPVISFDVTVKNQDDTLVTDGTVIIKGYYSEFFGSNYEAEIPVNENGHVQHYIPPKGKYREFTVQYFRKNNLINLPHQRLSGCDGICETSINLSFLIEINLEE